MRLTRTLDDMYWRSGNKGVASVVCLTLGTGAISVGSGFALAPDDVVAPMHRDLGCYLLTA